MPTVLDDGAISFGDKLYRAYARVFEDGQLPIHGLATALHRRQDFIGVARSNLPFMGTTDATLVGQDDGGLTLFWRRHAVVMNAVLLAQIERDLRTLQEVPLWCNADGSHPYTGHKTSYHDSTDQTLWQTIITEAEDTLKELRYKRGDLDPSQMCLVHKRKRLYVLEQWSYYEPFGNSLPPLAVDDSAFCGVTLWPVELGGVCPWFLWPVHGGDWPRFVRFENECGSLAFKAYRGTDDPPASLRVTVRWGPGEYPENDEYRATLLQWQWELRGGAISESDYNDDLPDAQFSGLDMLGSGTEYVGQGSIATLPNSTVFGPFAMAPSDTLYFGFNVKCEPTDRLIDDWIIPPVPPGYSPDTVPPTLFELAVSIEAEWI